MRPTPHQTYLAERLQSARGLGWEMPEASLPETAGLKISRGVAIPGSTARPPRHPHAKGSDLGWAILAIPTLLAAWLRAIR
jgi:hypothetical protein